MSAKADELIDRLETTLVVATLDAMDWRNDPKWETESPWCMGFTDGFRACRHEATEAINAIPAATPALTGSQSFTSKLVPVERVRAIVEAELRKWDGHDDGAFSAKIACNNILDKLVADERALTEQKG